jgi:hypothetical protein
MASIARINTVVPNACWLNDSTATFAVHDSVVLTAATERLPFRDEHFIINDGIHAPARVRMEHDHSIFFMIIARIVAVCE